MADAHSQQFAQERAHFNELQYKNFQMSLLEASLVAVDYANLEPEAPEKSEK